MADRKQIIEKIKALRAKADDRAGTEAEAMAAAEMAARLLALHEVKPEELRELQESVGAHDKYDQGKVLHPVAGWLATSIANLTETTAYRADNEINYVGTEPDVMMAVYLTEMMVATAKRGWLNLAEDEYEGLPFKQIQHKRVSYFQGFAKSVDAKLRALAAAQAMRRTEAQGTGHSTALVVAKGDIIKRKLDEMGIVLHKSRKKAIYADREAFGRGEAHGQTVNVNRPFGTNTHTGAIA